jgi:hypothetical protein
MANSLVSLEPSLGLWATFAPWGLGKHGSGAWVWRKVDDGWDYVGRAYLTTPTTWEGEIRNGPSAFVAMPTTYPTLQSCARNMV